MGGKPWQKKFFNSSDGMSDLDLNKTIELA